ncbi:hypothetical protein NP233_g12412 [Leucocoprinus birnbaumii]|uniref:Uncharacterized protein n=1 Tax=Leucocoprinus birnbaumii TaxID=56174 RepID=A0AAD5VEN3_9AGAR|nr:hypothetical protein NP233_g12412 [Leucocoprinus birnbaumii]
MQIPSSKESREPPSTYLIAMPRSTSLASSLHNLSHPPPSRKTSYTTLYTVEPEYQSDSYEQELSLQDSPVNAFRQNPRYYPGGSSGC